MKGVMALFETRDALLHTIAAAKERRFAGMTAFAPAYDAGILSALAATSRVPEWTLAGGIAGGAGGLAFMVWTVQQWPVLLVSGKPLVAWPPFFVVAFEMTILIAALAAAAAFLIGSSAARSRVRMAYEPSLSDSRFGLFVPCTSERIPEIGHVMMQGGAVTWRIV